MTFLLAESYGKRWERGLMLGLLVLADGLGHGGEGCEKSFIGGVNYFFPSFLLMRFLCFFFISVLMSGEVFRCAWFFFRTNCLLSFPSKISSKLFSPLCVYNHLFIGKINFLVSIAWSRSKLGDQVIQNIIWSLNFFLFIFDPFVHFDISYFFCILIFFWGGKSNINDNSKGVLITKRIKRRFF